MRRTDPEIKQTCAYCETFTDAESGNIFICPLRHDPLSDRLEENYVRKSEESSQTPSARRCDTDLLQGDSVKPSTNEEFKIYPDLHGVSKNVEDKNKDSGYHEKISISSKGINFDIDFQTCDNIYVNDVVTPQLNYSFRISTQDDYRLSIRNLKTNEETSYEKIIGEGSLSLKFPDKPNQHSQNTCQTPKQDPEPADISALSSNKELTSDTKLNSYETIEITSKSDELSVCDNLETTRNAIETILNLEPQEEDVNNSYIKALSSNEELTSVYSDTKLNRDSSCETIEITLNSDEPSVYENIETTPEVVETIFNSNTSKKICCNCNSLIEDETLYLCLFGHDSCWECKGKPCIICRTMMGEAKSYCKNHHKGCPVLEIPEHLIKHEIDCELNNFRCPFPRCVFLNTLSDLKLHFLNSHTKSLIQTNSILEVLYGRKDKKWYLYCYESLFVCSYYYYGSHIEFILQYIGANDKAKCFMFEVEIKSVKEKKMTKRVKCAGWNDVSLCKSVCYDCEELTNCDNMRFQFTANLKIVNLSNDGIYTSL